MERKKQETRTKRKKEKKIFSILFSHHMVFVSLFLFCPQEGTTVTETLELFTISLLMVLLISQLIWK